VLALALGGSAAAHVDTGEAVGFEGDVSTDARLRGAAELRAAAPDLQYLNLGVSGLRTSEVRAGQLAEALEFEPDLALVVCGGNDAFRPSYAGEVVEAVTADLEAMLAALRAAGAQPVTVGAFDVSYSAAIPDRYRLPLRQRFALLAEQTRVVAARHDCVHVDLRRHPRISDPTLYAPDGKHGNARCDAIAAAETVRALAARLRAGRHWPAGEDARPLRTREG